MNKTAYRIVFNKARNSMMAVPEIATSHTGNASGNTDAKTSPISSLIATLRPLTTSLLFALSIVSFSTHLAAQVVADPNAPKNQQPQIGQAGNGVTVVNIQTPSAAGVSRNQYQQFDVDNRGVILNNGRTTSNTQLGGYVPGNANLAGGTAKIILNEVNSANPSRLNGYIEIGGDRAQMVIANPSGITCNGCGFINASRATLTTGVPQLNNGALTGFIVNKGQILIEGNGLDASRLDYTDLIARSVVVNAGLWANQLKVVTGRNQVSHDLTQISKLVDTAESEVSAPEFAIDVAALGGMYAGKISLIGTEKGVGVRNANYIGASAGEVTISIDGKLTNSGVIHGTTGTSQIDAKALHNTGTIQSQNNLDINSAAELISTNQILTNGTLGINANSINNSGTIQSQNNLALNSATTFINSNQILTNGSLGINAHSINNSGTIQSQNNLVLNSVTGLTNSNQILTNGSLDIRAQSIHNLGNIHSLQNLSLNSQGQLTNSGSIETDRDAQIQAQSTHNSGNISSQGSIELNNTGELVNSKDIQANGALTITAQSIDNQQNALIAGGTHTQTTEHLVNRGTIDGGDTQIKATTLENLGTGKIYGDNLALQTDTLNNLSDISGNPVIASRNNLIIGTDVLNNKNHALIFSGNNLTIGRNIDVMNGTTTGKAGTIQNASASIEALGDLSITADKLDNLNLNFSTEQVEIDRKWVTEYQLLTPCGGGGCQVEYANGTHFSTNRYDPSQVYLREDDVITAFIGAEGFSDSFYKYNYQRITTETQIKTSDPAEILSGGKTTLNIGTLFNDNSRILAGGTLEANVNTLINTEVTGQLIVKEQGTVDLYDRHRQSGGDSQGIHEDDYRPADQVQSYALSPGMIVDGQSISTSGNRPDQLSGLTPSGLNLSGLNSSIFQQSKDPAGKYLIESDPRLTNYKDWLSSDYFFDQLPLDPNYMQKRLGDGFYEQKILREQISQLTGARFLEGYQNDEEQYRALIDSGVAVGKNWNLTPGIALTAEQMSQLTSDIVWMVAEEVTLPDGTKTTALIPKLYPSSTRPDGLNSVAMISGRDLILNVTGNIENSGSLNAQGVLIANAANITNKGNISGTDVYLEAAQNINHQAGIIQGIGSVTLDAGNDINIVSQTNQTSSAQGTRTNLDNVAQVRVTGTADTDNTGQLNLFAGNDINVNAGLISNQSETGQTQIVAGNDINLGTVATSQTQNQTFDSDNKSSHQSTTQIGSSINTAGDILLVSGRDTNLTGSSIDSASGSLDVYADRNINLNTSQGNDTFVYDGKTTGTAGASKITATVHTDQSDSILNGSSLSSDTINLNAGKDLNIIGSSVIATDDVNLNAANDIIITEAKGQDTLLINTENTKTGFSSNGGTSVGYGKQETTVKDNQTSTHSLGSTVGSVEGNLNISAGKDYTQKGSDLITPKGDISVDAANINILSSQDQSRQNQDYTYKQSGITLAISNPILNAIETADKMNNASKRTDNSRAQALAAGAAALSGYNAYDALNAGALKDGISPGSLANAAGGVNVSLSVGSSKQESSTRTQSVNQSESTLTAGGDISLIARDQSETKEGKQGNITISGSQVKADNNVYLIADNNINLIASQDKTQMDRDSKGSGASLGVGFGTSGFGVTASASQSKGKADGYDEVQNNTHVEAGNALIIQSGKDTNLIGAIAKGDTVIADIGGNLHIQSLQDIHDYKSKDQNISGSITVGAGVSGSLNVGQDKINSDYASVQEQSGIKAGDGGFDITVGKHTQLDGAVISSNQKAIDEGNNYFSTGTLDTTEIHNKAEYDASSVSIGGGFSSGKENPVGKDQQGDAQSGATQVPGTELPGKDGLNVGTPIAMSDSDKKESTTGSGISGGVIEIRDKDAQKDKTGKTAEETLANLDTTVTSEKEGAHALEQIFDEEEIKANFEITQAFINEVSTLKANMAQKADEAKAKWESVNADPNATVADKAAAYAEYESAQKWGPGGQYSQILTAITSAAGSNVSGSIGEMGTNALINYVQGLGAEQVKHLADSFLDKDGNKTAQSESARALLQGLLACGGAAASGNDCGSGALGAAGAVGLNTLLDALLKTDPEKMTAAEKLNRENLIGSIVAGIAEGTGNSANDALTGANTEMEHNYLKKPEVVALRDAQRMCSSGSAVACQKVKALEKLSEERDKKVVQACAEGQQNTPQCQQVKNELLAAQDGLYRPGDLVGKLFTDKELKALESEQSQMLDALIYLSYTPEERKNIKLTTEQALVVRDLLVDFSIAGNVKDFNEAETAGEYGLAALGIIPFDKLLAVAKGIKKADKVVDGLEKSITTSRGQLQHAFDHAADFGVKGNANNKTLAEFGEVINKHVTASGTKAIEGTYRGQPVTHFLDPKTGLNVIRDKSGNFLSGWKLSPKQLEHVLDNGKLGGGR